MARATARKRVTKQKTKKQKGIRVSKRPATAEEAANAAKCPSPKTHEEVFYDEDDEWPIPPDELLRQQIVGWQKQLAESDVALPTAETIKTAASLYWQTRYAQEKPDTPLHYHTAAGKACNECIRLIMSWMRKSCPDNLAIDSAFQNVVCAVRDGDFTGTQQLAELLKKQAAPPAEGKPKRKKTASNSVPARGTKTWYRYVICHHTYKKKCDKDFPETSELLCGDEDRNNTACRGFLEMRAPSQKVIDEVKSEFPGRELWEVDFKDPKSDITASATR
ncbi:MAG: hypothetical protein ABGZ53_13415 [Fuerstiella sp.]